MYFGSGKTQDASGPSPGNKNTPGAIRTRVERYDQMTKQQQLIEQKKKEIEAKLAADRHRKEVELLQQQQQQRSSALGLSSSSSANKPATSTPGTLSYAEPKQNAFANDGSFLDQFRKLQEKQNKEKEQIKIKEELDEYGYSGSLKKPAFKILNPPNTSTRGPSFNNQQDPALNTYYGAPPPPPPPPPPPQSHSSQDRKPAQRTFSPTGTQNVPTFQNVPPPPPPVLQTPWQPSPPVKAFAMSVADGGDQVEDMARKTKSNDPLLWFLYRPDSKEYQSYRDLVIQIRNEKSFQQKLDMTALPNDNRSSSYINQSIQIQDRLKRLGDSMDNFSEDDERDGAEKKKRSRWGPQSGSTIHPVTLTTPQLLPLPQGAQTIPGPFLNAPNVSHMSPLFSSGQLGHGPTSSLVSGMTPEIQPIRGPTSLLTRVTKTNPQLLSYARQSYGTVDLDEEQWKQCEEAYKMNLLFQDIARKKQRDEKLAQSGKFKHEYDSDEDVDDQGTWEHKNRLKEMEKTKELAQQLTVQAKGKHHIGDFLPPEELNKFMDKYKAVKEGRQMDESAYQDFKIAQDNVGFKLLQKMGWLDGQGLGSAGQGITAPIDKGSGVADKQGLGVEKPNDLTQDDDEYTAYRKRMMLAYRFRPNPLNNPRRAYY